MTRAASVVVLAVAAATLGVSGRARADDERGRDVCAQAAEDGQLDRFEGRLRSARARFVVCGQTDCPVLVRSDCLRWLDELSAAIPSVVFALRDGSGHDVTQVRLSVDGQLLTDRLDGHAIDVDPGEHVFRWEVAGAPPRERTLMIRQGEKSRVVDLTPEPSPSLAAREPTPRVDTSRATPTFAYVLGGVGIAALGVGAYAGVDQLARTNDLRSTCGTTASCDPRDVDAIRDERVVSAVLLGTGAVSLAVATVLLLWRAPASR